MFITESRAQLGFLPLQHEDYDKTVGVGFVDQRTTIFGLKIFEHQIGPEDRGTFKIDENSVGDVIGAFLWANTTRRIPAWRLGSWPTITVKERSPVDPSSFGVLIPPPGREARNDAQLGGERDQVNELKEIFLPILNDDWDEDTRFGGKDFKKPKIEVQVPVNPNARTSPRVKVGINAWPKFPVSWYGLALAADEELKQNELFMPADPRLVVVNKEDADPDAASRILEITEENEPDARRMARLHSAFRVLRGPPIFCDTPHPAMYEGKVPVGVLTWNIFQSGASDQLPGGLMIGPPSFSAQGAKNVVATISSLRGGPIDLGSDIDRHQIGSVDGLAINQGHISGRALYTFGPRGLYDAPILHNGLAVVGGAALPSDLESMDGDGGSIVPVFFVYDPTIPHVDCCGRTVPGHHRWFAVIPDEESARPEETGLQDVVGPFPPKPSEMTPDDPEFANPGPPPPPPPPPEGEPVGVEFRPVGASQRPPPGVGNLPPAGMPQLPPVFLQPHTPEGENEFDEEDEPTATDGPCTEGPIGEKPKTPEVGAAVDAAMDLFPVFRPESQPAPILNARAKRRTSGPQYRQGSMNVFQLLALSTEGHELFLRDRLELQKFLGNLGSAFDGAPYADRGEETFVDTGRARGVGHLFFRGSWYGDTAPNFAQWSGQPPGGGSKGPSRKGREARQLMQPLVGRLEGWGNQNDTILGFDYTDNLFRSRYRQLGTSTGGIALLPPETSIDDCRRGTDRADASVISLLLGDRVDLAIGAKPEVTDGSTREGWVLRERRDGTDDFSFLRGKTTAPVDGDSVFRFDQNDNAILDLGQGDADPAGGIGVVPMNDADTIPTGTPATGVTFYSTGGVPFVVDGLGVHREIGVPHDLVPTWEQFDVDATDFTAAANQEDIELFSLVAGGIIHGVKIKQSTAFSGGGSTVNTLSVGIAQTTTATLEELEKYASAFDVFQAVADDTFQLTCVFGSEDHGSATSIRVTLTSDVNVSLVGTGVAEIWVLKSVAV